MAGLGLVHHLAILDRPFRRPAIDAFPPRKVPAVEQDDGIRRRLAQHGARLDLGRHRRPDFREVRLGRRIAAGIGRLGQGGSRQQREQQSNFFMFFSSVPA
jgi:hypothetical protein